MSRGLLEFIARFALGETSHGQSVDTPGRNARRASAGSQF
jgi:hypothetical protein